MVCWWQRDQVVKRLNSLFQNGIQVLPIEASQFLADDELGDGIVIQLTDGEQIFGVLLEEGDKLCFSFESLGREFLIPKLDLMGKPN